ncbi:hypothetical protein HPP92_016265 [Vanilla planifolia]|uniref:Uncharacterized protein n=1 Tax=Vanilla planifolia TaxID=51239 RepID=A0A835QAL1_VANPL|nr:hypothetical protein HPP92_016265 [Vanilla planifolia]
MIAWPLYAEQKMNKEFLVKAAGLAVEMRGYKDEVVVAVEVEEKVRWLMESEGGKELRERALAVGESGRAAMQERDSAKGSMVELVLSLRKVEDGGRQPLSVDI